MSEQEMQALIEAHERRLTILETRFEDFMKSIGEMFQEVKQSLAALSTGNTPLCAQHREQIRTLEREMGEVRTAREADKDAAKVELDRKVNWKTFALVIGILGSLNGILGGWFIITHLINK